MIHRPVIAFTTSASMLEPFVISIASLLYFVAVSFIYLAICVSLDGTAQLSGFANDEERKREREKTEDLIFLSSGSCSPRHWHCISTGKSSVDAFNLGQKVICDPKMDSRCSVEVRFLAEEKWHLL